QVARGPPLAPERLPVEVATEKRRAAGGVDLELAVGDPNPKARQGPAHRALADRLADQVPGQVSRLGLAVAVADVEAQGVPESLDRLEVEGLAGRDHAAQGGQGPKPGMGGEHP